MVQDVVSVKVDGCFPEYGTSKLHERLLSGYEIIDKTVVGDRYIVYVLGRTIDQDLGKCSYVKGEPMKSSNA